MSVVLSTACFGPIAYYQAINRYGNQAIIDNHENYVKQSYRNRYAIYSPNKVQLLSVPVVKGRSPQQPIRAIRIAYDENWPRLHWQALTTAYNSSPFFEHYADAVFNLLQNREEYLVDFNRAAHRTIAQLIGLPQTLQYSHAYIAPQTDGYTDLRNLTQKHPEMLCEQKPYNQVFAQNFGFVPNLSILDLLFAEGPNAISYL